MATQAAAGPRPQQIIVWGATGFTGKLVCEHLARDYQVSLGSAAGADGGALWTAVLRGSRPPHRPRPAP
jgi:uncharacterized protein YbjT (DUF2867 family)